MSRQAPVVFDLMPNVWRERLIVSAPLIGLLVLAVWAPSDEGPTICPFALCTGTACPGCGMTRAASSLVRGDLGAALAYHPLVPIVGVQLLGAWAWFLLRRSGRVQPMSGRTLNFILITTLIALVGVWLARALTGTLPPV